MRDLRWTLAILIGMMVATDARAAGALTVQSDQPANVYFDGEMVGSTPARLTEIHAGTHSVRVQSQVSGQTQEFQLKFPRSASIDRQLSATFGAVAPAVVPGTPAVAVVPGASTLPLTPTVAQLAAQPVPQQQVLLMPPVDSRVEVHSNLPATVYLDGIYMGRAPLVISSLAPGFHSVRTVADGSGYSRNSPLEVPVTGLYHRRIDAVFHVHYAPVFAEPPLVVIDGGYHHHHHRW